MTIPLSAAQKRLWFSSQLERSPAYNIPVVLRLRGPLDRRALSGALADIVTRHEMLRTLYPTVDDEPVQHILDVGELPPLVEERTVVPDHMDDVVAELSREHFDLADELPVRSWLIPAGPEEHVFLLLLHHIAVDGWSIDPLLRDLGIAYGARVDGVPAPWPELETDYVDYAYWHAELLGEDTDADSLVSRQIAYWRTALAGLPDELALPFDRPRGQQAAHEGGTARQNIVPELHQRLIDLARQHDVTLFMVLQAAFATLLHRLGAGDDIPLGSPVAGRTDEALNDLVGFFVNTLVLRTDVSGNPSFTELLARVRERDLQDFAHQDVPFERLVEELNPARSSARHPLFQTMVVLQNNDSVPIHLPGLGVTRQLIGNGAAKFDLTLAFDEETGPHGEPAGLPVSLEYATHLFDRATADSILDRLVNVLAAVSADPGRGVGEIDVLSPRERRQLAQEWNDTGRPLTALVVPEVFAARAAAHPASVALICDGEPVSYAELEARSNQLAHELVGRYRPAGDIVSICLPRGPELVVAILATLKAGAGYSLLDPEMPGPRLRTIVEAAFSPVVIADRAQGARFTETQADVLCLEDVADSVRRQDRNSPPAVPIGPDDPACVMFTSGSTGAPKGVVAPHRAMVGTLVGQSYVDFAGEVVLQCSPVSWDAFALELFGPLLSGGTCVLQPGQRPEPAVIAELLRRHRVSTVHLSATLMNFMLDEYPGVFAGVRQLMTGGEPASLPHVRRALRDYPGLRLVNGYSPVENMIFTLCHRITEADTERIAVPVGRPIANKTVYVLDEHLELVPPGVPGELYMSGIGLALGYLGQSALTAERFVANPFGAPGERMYRTGDLVRWSREGVMDFLGRADSQIKIRGFRVEPREVEATLGRIPGVVDSVVLAREDRPGDKRLVAYVVPTEPGPSPSDLRERTAAELPAHLVPSAFVLLQRLPMTANGKLDRAALPVPEYTRTTTTRTPRTPREESLCGLFEEVLGVPEAGIDDSFFDLGGHSLLVVKLISRVRAKLQRELTIKAVFDNPTVAGLAGWLETAPQARPSLMASRRKRMAGQS